MFFKNRKRKKAEELLSKITEKYSTSVKVHVLNDDTKATTNEALGISEERMKELNDIIMEEYKKFPTCMDVIQSVSKHLKHPNELAYVSFTLGAFIGKQRGASEIMGKLDISSLLGGLFNDENNEDN